MKRPSVNECLSEIERLRAENQRLTRLAQSQRPELEALRDIEVGLRDFLLQADRLVALHAAARRLLPGNDDLPGLMELSGICSNGRTRIDAILGDGSEPPEAVGAVARGARDSTE